MLVGGKGVRYPIEFGLPAGADRNSLLLEIHFDLPAKLPVQTSAGMRLRYTEQLRPNDGAVLVVGTNVDEFLITPPQTTATRVGQCFGACTEATLPTGGINIVGSLLHMHTAGSAMQTRLIRKDGTEEAPLASDEHYDFNLQTFTMFEEPRKLMPGDTLETHCVYDTNDRNTLTMGGEATSAEMCLHYLIVWCVWIDLI